jgi:predicted phage tail protein
MKTVYLHGKLGRKFGKKIELNIDSVSEAILALDANYEGFMDFLISQQLEGKEYFFLKKNPKEISSREDLIEGLISKNQEFLKVGFQEIHLVPKAYGGFVTAVMGVVFGKGTLAAKIATSMVWGAITQVAMNALMKPPKSPEARTPLTTKSYIMRGAQNREAQGVPVPIGYGKLKVGGTTISNSKKSFPVSGSRLVKRGPIHGKTLESYSEQEMIDLICEGPIEGFLNKYGGPTDDITEAVYFNDVQVTNTDGRTMNYALEVTPQLETGSKNSSTVLQVEGASFISNFDTSVIGGSPYGKNIGKGLYNNINDAENAGAKSFAYQIEHNDTKKIRISFKTELSQQWQPNEKSQFETVANILNFQIQIIRAEGTYNILSPESGCNVSSLPEGITLAGNSFQIKGIATSAYEFNIDIQFSRSSSIRENISGITFKVVKMHSELDGSVSGGDVGGMKQSRTLQVAYVQEIIAEKFLYPNSAMIKTGFSSKNFSSVPGRKYHLKLKKVLIPNNYDPINRAYSGPWDGLFLGQESPDQSLYDIDDKFKKWTDNPAWIFLDILSNPVYGLGKYNISEENIDKWQLYKVAKYCDQLVPTEYPIEGETEGPRGFESKVLSDSISEIISIKIDPGFFKSNSNGYTFEAQSESEIKKQFIAEFGNGENFKGKKVAFFMYNHGLSLSSNQALTEEEILELKQKSAERGARCVLQERAIIWSDPNNLIVNVSGPSLSGSVDTVLKATNGQVVNVGVCAVQHNHPVVEPRFSCNLYITDRTDAIDIINSMSSIFRGMASYSSGKIFVTQDSFKKPTVLFNNSNVSSSGFKYSGTSKIKRPTACLVRFNNQEKGYDPDIIYEEDPDSMRKFGFMEKEVMGYGITSASQARRLAKWTLFTSQLETETIKFTAGVEASYLFPGCIFEVSDEMRAGFDKSGRILGVRDQIIIKGFNDDISISKPHILLDKTSKVSPNILNIELTVSAGQPSEGLDKIEESAPVELEPLDQETQIESIKSSQLIKFDGSIEYLTDVSDIDLEVKKTIVSNLKYKQPFEVVEAGHTRHIDSSVRYGSVLKSYNHGLREGEQIMFLTEGVLPAGLSKDRVYCASGITRHTFQVYDFELNASVSISDVGKNRFMDRGGEHYFTCLSSSKLQNILTQISIGCPYSIKGLIGVRSENELSNEEKEKLGIDLSLNSEFLRSEYLGMISPQNEWVFSPTLNWVYVEQIKTAVSNHNQMWLFQPELGWFWTNSQIKNSFWYILESDKWVNVIFNSIDNNFITGFFVYDENHSFAVGDTYTLGVSKKLPIVYVANNGYLLSLVDDVNLIGIDFEDFVPESFDASVFDVSLEENTAYFTAKIKEFHIASSRNSLQSKQSVIVEFFEGHGLDLETAASLDISAVNSSSENFNQIINSNWTIAYVNKNTVELVPAVESLTAELETLTFETIDNDGSIGVVTYLNPPESEIQRNLESQMFRVLSINELSQNKYEVTGLEYNPQKFDLIEKKGGYRKPKNPIPPQADMHPPEPPSDLVIKDINF